jgi:hypothetical protein
MNSQAVVGTTEGNVGLGVYLEFDVEDEGFRLEEDDRVSADGFDREFRGLKFGKGDGLTQEPSGDVWCELFGDEFAGGVVGHEVLDLGRSTRSPLSCSNHD